MNDYLKIDIDYYKVLFLKSVGKTYKINLKYDILFRLVLSMMSSTFLEEFTKILLTVSFL